MQNTLVISDLHLPYQHVDALDFIREAKYVYSLDEAKCTGDITDQHAGSFHELEYGVLSAKEEHERAYASIQELNEIYPSLTVVVGNHDAITRRKAKAAGIPLDHLKDYNTLYDVDWTWTDRDFFRINKDTECLLVHTMSTSTLNNAARHSHCSIQGHHHSNFGIEYFADTNMLRWSMTAGCLIDLHHPAFNYASGATMKRPILGMSAIIDDMPRLLPMNLTKKGRWDGIV